jgi:OOP family OmpA-OmpF porin
MKFTNRVASAAALALALAFSFAPAAHAQFSADALKKSAKDQAKKESEAKSKKAGLDALEKKINDKLLADARANQCSFKSGTDQFEGACDDKVQNLFNSLVDAKKQLTNAGVSGFKFEVSGHTDTTGNANANKQLSEKRAAKIVKELVKKGIPEKEIIAIGMGSTAPLVTPDDTKEKQAQNRRYEIRVRLLAN